MEQRACERDPLLLAGREPLLPVRDLVEPRHQVAETTGFELCPQDVVRKMAFRGRIREGAAQRTDRQGRLPGGEQTLPRAGPLDPPGPERPDPRNHPATGPLSRA